MIGERGFFFLNEEMTKHTGTEKQAHSGDRQQ